MKYKTIIAGLPTLVTVDMIRSMTCNLSERAKSYFGQYYCKEEHCNIVSACYIDNYITLIKFIADEEERRVTAWEFTKNSMDLDELTVRPDIIYVYKPIEADSTMIIRFNKLLNKFPDAWCGMRFLMNLEWHEKWRVSSFFQEVVVANDIDHIVGRTYNKFAMVRINMIDYCEKYYCEKYGILLEDLGI